MFGGNGGGIGNILDILKHLDLKKLDFSSIASKIIPLIPDGKGKEYMDVGLNIAKSGGSSKDVKKGLENLVPGFTEKLNDPSIPQVIRQVWNNIPDDKDAVPQYGANVLKQLQLLKK